MTFQLIHSFEMKITFFLMFVWFYWNAELWQKLKATQKLHLGGHWLQSSTSLSLWKWTFKPFSKHFALMMCRNFKALISHPSMINQTNLEALLFCLDVRPARMTAILVSIKTRKLNMLISYHALTFAPVGWLLSVPDMNRSYRLSFIPMWLSLWKNSKTQRQEVLSLLSVGNGCGADEWSPIPLCSQASAWTELYNKKDRLHPAIIIILDIIYGFESLKHILEQSLILVL